MIATPQPQKMTVATYLDWEPRQDLRYEFVNGDVFATTGGSLPHVDVLRAVATLLNPARVIE